MTVEGRFLGNSTRSQPKLITDLLYNNNLMLYLFSIQVGVNMRGEGLEFGVSIPNRNNKCEAVLVLVFRC